MFNFLKRKKDKKEVASPQEPTNEVLVVEELIIEEPSPTSIEVEVDSGSEPTELAVENQKEKTGLFKRLKSGLSKTRSSFTQGLGNVVFGKKIIDDELLEALEEQLLLADVGIDACTEITKNLTLKISRKELGDTEALMFSLKQELIDILKPSEAPLVISKEKSPYVILMVGVNGAGKTTTIGKLAKRFQTEGKKVMLAAGDTFRAAAIEQLQVWGERNNIAVVAQQQGSDSASVAFDALQSAKAKGMDVLIIDTAGRLHTQNNLMQELEKVKRVVTKLDASAPHEILLVLDSGNGQNALSQATQFQKVVDVSGITLTKLDGTAKGGIIFAISKTLGIPIRFIGVGEKIDDLRVFNAEDFVEALFIE